MGRLRVFLAVLVAVLGSGAFATDYRLVVASDNPAHRKVPAIVIYEGNGKLSSSDRITSVTFSRAGVEEPNCLISFDPNSGKQEIQLGPEVQVFRGKALLAGSKPTNKVIPGYLMVDNPLPVVPQSNSQSVMAPIITRVNNIPWLYIIVGVGIFMGFMFLMNRKSQTFTSNMTQEAKNLYVETVGRIVDRLERIEANQEQLVKNPPVLRAFRVQIADFEGRLTRIEKLSTEVKDEHAKTSQLISSSEQKFNSLAGFMESAKNEALQTQSSVKRESEGIRADVRTLGEALKEAQARIAKLDDVGAQARSIDAKVDAIGNAQAQTAKQTTSHAQQLQAEVEAVKSALNELKSMHQQIAGLVAGLPAEIQSVRAAIPTLDVVESKLSEIKGFESKFDRLDEISTKLDHLPEIKGSLDALPQHFPKLDDSIVRADFQKLAAQLEALNEIKITLAALPSQMPKMEEGVAKSKDLEKLFGQLSELSEIKDKLEALPSQMPKVEEGLAKTQDFEKLFSQLSELSEIKDKLEALPSKLPKLDANLAKSHDLEKLSTQLAELKEIKNKLEELPAQMPNLGENLADFQDSLKKQIDGLNGKLDESVERFNASNEEEEGEGKRKGKKGKGAKDEPEALVPANEAKNSEPDPPAAIPTISPNAETGEFSFNNAIREMNQETEELRRKEEEEKAAKAAASFKMLDLPSRLETFEDSEPEAVLPTFKPGADDENADDDKAAVELLLMELTSVNQPNLADEEFDHIEDVVDFESEDGKRWSGIGGGTSRTWSAHSSRPLELVPFEGELKPVTPIETAPSGDPIGAVAFGFGRVLYSCGVKVHGFWPGREGRSIIMDHPIPTDDWRLATNGQSLFVAEPKKVKIVSLQGWFVLEQFNGEYYDQMVTKSHWVGLRNDKGAVMDIRNHRGQPIGEGINLGTGLDGIRLCGHGNRIFTGTAEGLVNEVTELGTEKLGQGPEGASCEHLTFVDGGPLAIFRIGGKLEAWHFGEKVRQASLETSSFSGKPMIIGHSMYLADVDNHVLISLDVKKMTLNKVPAFQGVGSLRRNIGIQHKGQHTVFAITTDEGKRGGRLISIDAKNGWETTFSLVGQATVNLIAADHHLVISTSNQYQNLVRVLEPFQLKAAA
jgi:hypothetical protein